MRIRYVGLAGLRVLDEYRWSAENDFVVEVEPQTAARLLDYPRADFALAQDEPLAAALIGMGEYAGLCAAALAREGIGAVEQLAALDGAQAEAVAGAAGVSAETVTAWVEAARDIVETRAAVMEPPADEMPDEGEEE